MAQKKAKFDLEGLDDDPRQRSPQSAPEAATAPKTTSAPRDTSQTKAPSRVGKSLVGAYVTDDVKKQLKRVALEQDKTIQQLVSEGLNHVFVTYGEPEIADTSKAER